MGLAAWEHGLEGKGGRGVDKRGCEDEKEGEGAYRCIEVQLEKGGARVGYRGIEVLRYRVTQDMGTPLQERTLKVESRSGTDSSSS